MEYHSPKIKAQGRFVAFDPVEIRALDILGAVFLLLSFLPLMILIGLAVFVSNPGPIFFSQLRLGRDGKPFKCHKFRTMATDAEARLANLLSTSAAARAEWDRDYKLRHDPRIVGIGRFLRKSSLDELPQLWNVLVGDMSLVGPRPIVAGELSRYGRYARHYYSVRPGLTGLWQISGRNDVSYRRRVAYDVLYARKGRIGDNVRILVLTIPCVLARRGSY
ncbi:sugar transferase [Sphingomonas qomolangmaensis]|uniref:Sugar transferase n=1 Tax=Sphingomonas qomolangmaensis TaxID=2918765 RepID=A0ABY5LCH7_9SPHN|nr:sugar transferase [Sphingomonas qomolangmaensis]UUL82396.1 sugar transferase [Sphingomonas qomolangmaensis]